MPEALLVSVVLAALIILFIAQSFLGGGAVPWSHPSMMASASWWKRSGYRFSEPKRGDVVVFRYPGDPRRKFIKRVIGLPGDEIVIKNGFLHINGQRIEEDYINGPPTERTVLPRSDRSWFQKAITSCSGITGATAMTAAIPMWALCPGKTSWAGHSLSTGP